MRPFIIVTIAMIGMLTGCRAMLGPPALRLYDLKTERTLDEASSLARLAQARIILVGEQHNDAWDHQAQLRVIRLLVASGKKVAIGLEMFRHDSQADLNRWVSGKIDEAQFKPIYLDNWNFNWALYRPIFIYARDHDVPMVGLNVARGVAGQVATHGFASLSDAQKRSLGTITCDVTPDYRTYLREAYDMHAGDNMTFENFCEAQLVWDTAMAVNATHYVKGHPDTILVILTGVGHAHKQGIPTQLAKRGPWPYLVLLPETPGLFEPGEVTSADADYLILR